MTKKMQVTLTVQIELDYDENDQGEYHEKLELLIQDLEELELKVDVDSEVPAWEGDDDY